VNLPVLQNPTLVPLHQQLPAEVLPTQPALLLPDMEELVPPEPPQLTLLGRMLPRPVLVP
jgi:hypothetical protein